MRQAALALLLLATSATADEPRAGPPVTPPVMRYDLADPRIPKKAGGPAPVYPTRAEAEKIAGEVWLRVTVDKTGRVTGAEIGSETPGGYGFGEAALAAVVRTTFTMTAKTEREFPYEIKFKPR